MSAPTTMPIVSTSTVPVVSTSTPTLVRVKRRLTEEPNDVLVLSAKRLKSFDAGTRYRAVLPLPLFFQCAVFFLSWMQGQEDHGSGSASKNLSSFNKKIVSKLSEIWSGFFLNPRSGSWLFTYPGSGSAILLFDPHLLFKNSVLSFYSGQWIRIRILWSFRIQICIYSRNVWSESNL